MSSDDRYHLDAASGVPLLDQVRAVAHSQIDAALAAVTDPGDDVAGAVHEARKCAKKLRGLIRLVRPGLGDAFGPANAAFRDAAGELGPLRDAHALAASFDQLVGVDGRMVVDLSAVAHELHRRSAEASALVRRDAPQLAAAAVLLRGSAGLVEQWTLPGDEAAVLRGGLAKTFERGRKALACVLDTPSTEAFHEYRKRCKYTWYHLRLLESAAPSVLSPMVVAFDELSDLLGDEHDLAVLSELLVAGPAGIGGDGCAAVGDALLVIGGRRHELQRAAVVLGRQLHAETSEVFAAFVSSHWAGFC